MPYADLVLTGGHVLTMSVGPAVAKAVAIAGDRLLAVGSERELTGLIGPQTEVLSLNGATVLPGFIDSHNHQTLTGQASVRPSLSTARAVREIQAVLRTAAAGRPAGEWIICASDWRDVQLAEQRMPTRWELDAAAPRHPVYLPMGGHLAAANTLALERAGVSAAGPRLDHGIIERDPGSGEPTGVFREPGALAVLKQVLPPDTPEEIRAGIRAACARHHRAGITSVVDPAVSLPEAQAYYDLCSQGELTVRTSLLLWVHGAADCDRVRESLPPALLSGGPGSPWLRFGGVKAFLDGGIMLGTALLSEPYFTGEHSRGLQLLPAEELYGIISRAGEFGWPVGVHASGDGAVRLLLDLFERAAAAAPATRLRHQIIHAHLVAPADLPRLQQLGAAVVVQPVAHARAERDGLRHLFGPQRAARLRPLRSMLRAGLRLAASSDAPIFPFPPLLGIWAAVTRRDLETGTALGQEEGLDRAEALRLYTAAGAWVTGEEHLKGSLEPGKLADLVVLGGDPLTCGEDELKDLPVQMTIVGGRIVHRLGALGRTQDSQ